MNKINGKFVVTLLVLMVIIHLIVFIIYAQTNKRAEATVNHDIVVQQVLNIIEKIYAAPEADQAKVASTVDIPNVTVSINKNPQWQTQVIKDVTLWVVNQKIQMQHEKIQLSIKLADNKWLNISANIIPTSWWIQVFLLSLEIIAITAVIFSFWSINRFAIPLKQFRKAADRLGIDLDPPPLAEYGPTRVRETAKAMNKMQQRIRDLIQERTQMLAALSHDLRTPITRMKLRAQFIEDEELYQKNIKDLDEMEQMIAETLAFAKTSSHLENKVKLDLNSLLSSISDDFIDLGYSVRYNTNNERLLMQGRPVALKRAFNNLMVNAIKYAHGADISFVHINDDIAIYFDDNGPGIPEDQLDKVFEPFYRADTSRSRTTGGTGLGLAVCRDIVRAHNGSVHLDNKPEGGLRVTVKLPIERQK